MQQVKISKAILSLGTGAHIANSTDEESRSLARSSNEYASQLKRQYPGKFGFFASLPLPDVAGSLAEIEYAFSNLDPDGVAVVTNYDGRYLGDATFDPVFAELSKRNVTVFVHPTIPCVARPGSSGCLSAVPLSNFTPAIAEFLFDTTRAFMNLVTSGGTIDRFPGVKFILAHGGAAIPPIIDRFSRFSRDLGLGKAEKTPAELREVLQTRFYFDLAGFIFPTQIHGLRLIVNDTRLLFGSDYPYTPTNTTMLLAREFDEGLPNIVQDPEARVGIYRRNADAFCCES